MRCFLVRWHPLPHPLFCQWWVAWHGIADVSNGHLNKTNGDKMAKKKEAQEEPLEKQLWKSADKLRKNIDAFEHLNQ
jgi:hypothetical protein